jgi:hypothetical protein
MLGALGNMSTAQLLVLAVVAVAAYGIYKGWDFCAMLMPGANKESAAPAPAPAAAPADGSTPMKGRMAPGTRRAGCTPCRAGALPRGASIKDAFAIADQRNRSRFASAEAKRLGRDGCDVFARGRADLQSGRIARAAAENQDHSNPDALHGVLSAQPNIDIGVSRTEYGQMSQASLPAETRGNHDKWVASLTEGRVGGSSAGMSPMQQLSTMSAAYGVDREESPLTGVRGLWPILTARDSHRRMFAAQPSLGDTDGRDTTPGVSVLGTPVVASIGAGKC